MKLLIPPNEFLDQRDNVVAMGGHLACFPSLCYQKNESACTHLCWLARLGCVNVVFAREKRK